MTLKEILNFPENAETDLNFETLDDKVRFTINGLATSWIDSDDSFLERIRFENLNPDFLDEHLMKEIEIRNLIDEAIVHLKRKRYPKAIQCLDEAIYYDGEYAVAILNKSYALEGQGHFVKALRHYRKAVRCDETLKDNEYYKNLVRKANDERSDFPKIKRNIYAGDEHFTKGEYEKAVESYGRALEDTSKFKDKILSKLLNKKATALLKLDDYDNAMDCFRQSLNAGTSDYAHYGIGICEYNMGLDVSDEFRRLLKVTKKQSLKQAMILNKLGFHLEALKICDFLVKNHFKCDEYYFSLMDLRKSAADQS